MAIFMGNDNRLDLKRMSLYGVSATNNRNPQSSNSGTGGGGKKRKNPEEEKKNGFSDVLLQISEEGQEALRNQKNVL